jgi:RNA polymerase sigma-70 factor (ECF subfamily)
MDLVLDEKVLSAGSAVGATLSDEEVVARVLGGDTGLFEVLMRRYNQRLFRVARAIVRDETEAEDVMQETYVRAFAALGQFEGRAPWATWLTRIAVNEALARVRRRGRFVSREAADVTEDDMDSDEIGQGVLGGRSSAARATGPEETASARELSAFVERAVDDLPDGYRMVFMLREVEELSTSETAACLDISEELVKVRLHRGRAELRRLLDARLGSATREVFGFHLSRCDRVVAAVMAQLAVSRPVG